jgi:hypothetical protein
MAKTDKMRQAMPSAYVTNDPNTSPITMRVMGDIIVAMHPLINKIQTTIEVRALKIGGIL